MPPLEIPPLLTELIAAGRWPSTPDEAREQNGRSLVSADRVRAFAPEEETIYLYCPPFRTAQERVAHAEEFWTSGLAAPEQVTFDKALVIGDLASGPMRRSYSTTERARRIPVCFACDGRRAAPETGGSRSRETSTRSRSS